MKRHRHKKLKKIINNVSIDRIIKLKVDCYLKKVREVKGDNLHPNVMCAVEKALLQSVLEKTLYNQVRSAEILGINRNTLRAKIREYKIKIQ